MQSCQFSTPALKQAQDLTNVQLSLNNKIIFHVHSAVVCFGERGSELLFNRLQEHQCVNERTISLPIELQPTEIEMVLQYMYNGIIPKMQLVKRQSSMMTVEKSRSKQLEHLDHVLKMYNCAVKLQVHTLVARLETNILEFLDQPSYLTNKSKRLEPMEQLVVHNLILVTQGILDDGENASESVLKTYLDRKKVSKNDWKKLTHAVASQPAKTQKNAVTRERSKRLRRLSNLAAKKNIVVKVAAATEQEESMGPREEMKEDEEEEEEEDEEMQTAIVINPYTTDDGCLSIAVEEMVEVLYFDENTGWAGIVKLDGSERGYVPIYCLYRVAKTGRHD